MQSILLVFGDFFTLLVEVCRSMLKYAEQDLMVCGEFFTLLVEVCRSIQKYAKAGRALRTSWFEVSFF